MAKPPATAGGTDLTTDLCKAFLHPCMALPQQSEFVLEEVSTTRSSGWMSAQRAKFAIDFDPNG